MMNWFNVGKKQLVDVPSVVLGKYTLHCERCSLLLGDCEVASLWSDGWFFSNAMSEVDARELLQCIDRIGNYLRLETKEQ